MNISESLLVELQNRLKVGNRRGVHLNAIPGKSQYKFDLNRISLIDKELPNKFIEELTSKASIKFKIEWPNVSSDDKNDIKIIKYANSFEKLYNQIEDIKSERGINTFGFGFPLIIKRDKKDNKLTVAPLLIWSLSLQKRAGYNKWCIQRNSNDPIFINEILINHLASDSQICLDKISDDLLDDGIIDKKELVDICINILEKTSLSDNDSLKESLSINLNNIKPIATKDKYEKEVIDSNNSIIDFAGLFSIFEVQKQNIINEYNTLIKHKNISINQNKIENNSFQSITSVQTDPSQQGILDSLGETRHIVIQGPPGTGKSQSLSAILINALENKKKTLVVCEKQTALEILKNTLDEQHLDQSSILIKDATKDRRLVVDTARQKYENPYSFLLDVESNKNILEHKQNKINSLIELINKNHLKLDKKLLGNNNWTDIVGRFLERKKTDLKNIRLDINKDLFNFNYSEYKEIIEILNKGEELYNEYQKYKHLSFINNEKFIGDNVYKLEDEFKNHFKDYKSEFYIINTALQQYKDRYVCERVIFLNKELDKINQLAVKLNKIISDNKNDDTFYDIKKTNSLVFKLTSIFIKKNKIITNDQNKCLDLLKRFNNLTSNSSFFKDIQFTNDFRINITLLSKYMDDIKDIENDFNKIATQEIDSCNIQKYDSNDSLDLLGFNKRIKQLVNRIKKDNWVKINSNENSTSIINDYLNDFEKLENQTENIFYIEFYWFSFYKSLSTLHKSIIKQLLTKTNWENCFTIFYLDAILIKNADSTLLNKDKEINELNTSIKNIKEAQLKYINEYWISEELSSCKRFENENENISIKNLYNLRKSNRHKRLSLRQIIKKDINLFTDFFPIILTTPDTCSTLFSDYNEYFDFVMFDEASQLRLEDNLPALLKGKQIIVAGDEHQMPPSNYFTKIFEGESGEDDRENDDVDENIEVDTDDLLLSCESLLDCASELNFEKKHLDFHYRSKHPYLIDFSNYAFYEQRLIPMPNTTDYNPIKYYQLNGSFIDNVNDKEAEKVLDILEFDIKRNEKGEYPSVGVATFNMKQRDYILKKINERRCLAKYKDFNNKITELEQSGFFVKNLENIQGDERDVIILSTTYGRNIDGKFYKRFGSVNTAKGYKLLNVIITRAKYSLYVCSSIPEEVILNYKEALEKEGSNNRAAVFYAYLAYTKAISENNQDERLNILNTLKTNYQESSSHSNYNNKSSLFAKEVYQSLINTIDNIHIEYNLQFAGFNIDVALISKELGIKIAIECDGADFHSSKEAYLYDIHRKNILQNSGFIFIRIWSTNWWRNQENENIRLTTFIKSVIESKSKEMNKN